MNQFELLNAIYLRNITLQQLVAYVVKAFALNYHIPKSETAVSSNASSQQKQLFSTEDEASSPTSIGPNEVFARVLSTLSKKDKTFSKFLKDSKYKMSHGKLFQNGKTSKPLLKEIDVMGLDSSFLLNLLINTDFLEISATQGKCGRNHSSQCCSNCNHLSANGMCNNCNKAKSHCEELAMICCSECNLCTSCCKHEYDRFYKAAMSKNAQPNAYQDCVMYIFKNYLLKDAINFRNLFHLTLHDCEDFLNGRPSPSFSKFHSSNLNTAEELLQHIEIVMNSMICLMEICFKNKSLPIGINEVKLRLECKDLETNFLEIVKEKFDFKTNEIKELAKQLNDSKQWKEKIEKQLNETEQWKDEADKRFHKMEQLLDMHGPSSKPEDKLNSKKTKSIWD